MGVDPSTDDVMARKPRKLTDRVIDAEMWGDIIFIGVIMAAVTLIGMDMHLAGACSPTVPSMRSATTRK